MSEDSTVRTFRMCSICSMTRMQLYIGPLRDVRRDIICSNMISIREKKYRRNHFEVCKAVHEPVYHNVKRPVDPATKDPIEPAHEFVITLEPDKFTDEKCDACVPVQITV